MFHSGNVSVSQRVSTAKYFILCHVPLPARIEPNNVALACVKLNLCNVRNNNGKSVKCSFHFFVRLNQFDVVSIKELRPRKFNGK